MKLIVFLILNFVCRDVRKRPLSLADCRLLQTSTTKHVFGAYGRTIVDTVETQRARELKSLNDALTITLTTDERLDVLLQVKWIIQVRCRRVHMCQYCDCASFLRTDLQDFIELSYSLCRNTTARPRANSLSFCTARLICC